MIATVLLLAACYLAGSFNWAVLFLRAVGRADPREAASGNPGVTNVYRVAGPLAAAAVLGLDVLRAAGASLAAGWFAPAGFVPVAGLALILGNRFPLFHGFRGGKGVANYLGFTAAVHPLAAGIACAAWLLVYAVARVSSVGSFAMLAVLAAGNLLVAGPGLVPITATLATLALILAAHRRNLAELRNRSLRPGSPP